MSTPEKKIKTHREICSSGGKATVQRLGTEHMRQIGLKGGQARFKKVGKKGMSKMRKSAGKKSSS